MHLQVKHMFPLVKEKIEQYKKLNTNYIIT